MAGFFASLMAYTYETYMMMKEDKEHFIDDINMAMVGLLGGIMCVFLAVAWPLTIPGAIIVFALRYEDDL